MFKSVEHKTFWPRFGEVLVTVALAWFGMLLVASFFKVVGLASVSFNDANTPVLGFSVNYWLQSHSLTFGEALASPSAYMVVIIIFGAPFLEEILFRGFVCNMASDDNGHLKPRGIFTLLAGSFILFGLVHGRGYFSVLIQGVVGLFLARLWFRNGPGQKSSYFSCVAAHSLYNISVVATTWFATTS